MLEKYEHLIYHSEKEKAIARKSYGEWFEQVWNEDKHLFDLTAEKYGKSLWAGLAWKTVNCKEQCPFGRPFGNDDCMFIQLSPYLCKKSVIKYLKY